MLKQIGYSPALQRLLSAKPKSAAIKEVKEFSPNYCHIAKIHYKAFATDGVSLDIQNFRLFFEQNNMKVFCCSGDVPAREEATGRGKRFDNLSYQSARVKNLTDRVFAKNVNPETKETDQEKILQEILDISLELENDLETYVNYQGIGVLDIRNIFSLPYNLPATLALYRLLLRRKDLLFLLHHHDFVWEWEARIKKFTSEYKLINELVSLMFPPYLDQPNYQHVVLSSIAEAQLRKRGIENIFVSPDSFDFSKLTPLKDPEKGKQYLKDMKKDLWKSLGIGDNDIVLGCMTRITPRKRIELTIQLIHEMQKIKKSEETRQKLESAGGKLKINNGEMTAESQFVLFLCQDEDLDHNQDYYQTLQSYAQKLGVKLVLAGKKLAQSSDFSSEEEKIYYFLDAYFLINGMGYPSEQEGFGNQFLEGVWAGHVTPIVRYPVFEADIKQHIHYFIDQGEPRSLRPLKDKDLPVDLELFEMPPELTQAAAREWFKLMLDPDKYQELAAENLAKIRSQFDAKVVGQRFLTNLDDMRRQFLLSRLREYV